MMMRKPVYACTGPNGRLGSALVRRGILGVDVDVTNKEQVSTVLGKLRPDVLINCAAFTDVDACELEPRKASMVNGVGVAVLRDAFNGRFIQISTDFVFDGKDGPYDELYTDYHPINTYGRTKLFGESILRDLGATGDLIVRTTVLFGWGKKPDFVSKVVNGLQRGQQVPVTDVLHSTPTYIEFLADALVWLVHNPIQQKVINLVGTDYMTRYEFARQIAKAHGFDPNLIMKSDSVASIACRPIHAGLKADLALSLGIPGVKSSLEGLKNYANR